MTQWLKKISIGILIFFIINLNSFILVDLWSLGKSSFLNAHASLDLNIFVHLTKKVSPSVVNISTMTMVKSPFLQGSPDDVLRKFFGDLFRHYSDPGRMGENEEDRSSPRKHQPRIPKAMSLGTGVIIDRQEGLILTNNHVVADADEIKVTFTESPNEKPSDAEVVGRDPEIDIALIKVKDTKLIPAEALSAILGDSDILEKGEFVMAVGNPFGHGHSVTHGIISEKGRIAPDFPLANYLQTDAPINPGNSGGPLVNLRGEVIGINNAIDQRAQGIGFAIPINLVKKVLPQLRTKGVVARGYIGILVEPLAPEIAQQLGLSKEVQGPVVSHVYPGDPADQAGIQPYDVILEFNGQKIQQGNDLIQAVTGVSVGTSVPLKVFRNGAFKTLQIKVGQRPGSPSIAKKDSRLQNKHEKSQIDTGMQVEDITPEMARELRISDHSQGVVVMQMTYGGPADQAGLLRGDVILEVDRKKVKNVEHFHSLLKTKKSYLLRVRRHHLRDQEAFTVVILNLNSVK